MSMVSDVFNISSNHTVEMLHLTKVTMSVEYFYRDITQGENSRAFNRQTRVEPQQISSNEYFKINNC